MLAAFLWWVWHRRSQGWWRDADQFSVLTHIHMTHSYPHLHIYSTKTMGTPTHMPMKLGQRRCAFKDGLHSPVGDAARGGGYRASGW